MTCPACGRWVPPAEALDTDEGRFHDHLKCLSEESYEALVARYACRCDRSIAAMHPIDRAFALERFCE